MTWRELQSEVATWATHNFSENPAWRPLLGLVEEVGEYYAAQVWSESEAPDRAATRAAIKDSLGDQAIYAVALCQEVGAEFSDVTADPRNVASYLSDRELVGAIAVAARSVLKHSQGIRGFDDTKRLDGVVVAVGLWYRWVQAQARVWALGDYYQAVRDVWSDVRKRDWKAHPADADKLVTWSSTQDIVVATANICLRCKAPMLGHCQECGWTPLGLSSDNCTCTPTNDIARVRPAHLHQEHCLMSKGNTGGLK